MTVLLAPAEIRAKGRGEGVVSAAGLSRIGTVLSRGTAVVFGREVEQSVEVRCLS